MLHQCDGAYQINPEIPRRKRSITVNSYDLWFLRYRGNTSRVNALLKILTQGSKSQNENGLPLLLLITSTHKKISSRTLSQMLASSSFEVKGQTRFREHVWPSTSWNYWMPTFEIGIGLLIFLWLLVSTGAVWDHFHWFFFENSTPCVRILKSVLTLDIFLPIYLKTVHRINWIFCSLGSQD